MKIVSRKEFLTLPEGTLFSKCKPVVFYGFSVRGNSENYENDFLYRDLITYEASDSNEFAQRFDEMLEDHASYPIEDAYGRDGCFNDEDLFLIYEADDLDELAAVIKKAKEALKDG